MQDSVNQPGFLFHDYETFGTSPSLDRPAQFAAIRTDAELNVLGEPEVFYCKPADDYLPQPQAVMITGITPQEALAKGDNEATFARRIHDLFTVPQTCIVGYNNVRFDDEVTRNIFYRNFYDPYAWSWQHDNSRWDLLDVMRACYALRPEGIAWPENDEGLPSFRLEHLTVANGIEHQNAHDAMADVYATIAMAKLVKTRQPRLFDYLYSHRNKRKLATLIDVPQMKPLVHVSGMFGAGLVLYVAIQSDVHLDHILFGDMLGISLSDIGQTTAIALVIAFIIGLKWRDFLLHAFDPTQAKASGLRGGLLHYGLLCMIALTIVATLQSVGIILSISLLIAPGAIALLLVRRFIHALLLAVAVAIGCSAGGVWLAFYLDSAPAPTIVVLFAMVFIVTFVVTSVKARRQERVTAG